MNPSPGRLPVIDGLRGFALLGIIVSHVSLEYIAGMTPPGYTNKHSALDQVVGMAADILTFGKFFTIFSFLFGLSFAIQLTNAQARGERFTLRFLWRLAVLLAIGFVHSLFYTGDILMIYAILGAVLVLCQRLGSKALVITGVLLLLNVPAQIFRVESFLHQPTAAQQQQQEEMMKGITAAAEKDFAIKRDGTLSALMVQNATTGTQMRLLFQLFTGRFLITIGLFLLGLAAGRRSLFVDSPANRQFWRRLLIPCTVVTLIATPLAWTLNPTMMGDATRLDNLIGMMMFDLHSAALSVVYVAGFTLLFWTRPAPYLRALVPAGQMGLTTYLTQNFVGVTVFLGFGFGLMGRLGITAEITLAVLFFGLQLWLARLWMSRFRLGPAEWLWRSLTYFRLQPMRRRPQAAATSA